MYPLDGVRLKLSRAQKHLNAANDMIDSFIAQNPYNFICEPNPTLPGWNVVAKVKQFVPDNDLGCIIGDFAHNARSALDHLVYQLSTLPPEDKGRYSLQFPIFDTIEGYRSKVKSYLSMVASKYLTIIEGFQPYNRMDGFNNDALGFLRAINDSDKHRTIHVVGAIATIKNLYFTPHMVGGKVLTSPGTTITIGHGGFIDFSGFRYESVGDGIITKDCTEIGKIIVNMRMPTSMQMHPEPQIMVKFGVGNPRIEGCPVMDTLTFIYDRVKEVVGRFEPFF